MDTIAISSDSKLFPKRLQHLAQPPKQLFCSGQPLAELLTRPTLGIVGARKVTAYGTSVTNDLAGAAARHGLVVVSGLALGVDSIAHTAAIKSGGGTVAVLPSGVKAIYPASHHHLAKQIREGVGVLVSEYPDDQRPERGSFIARNRIIAGLSDALLVTEAAEKSGSLHTARFALELGRTVMAVPGNITSALSAGTNNLIKAGAIPVTCIEDILHAMGLTSTRKERTEYYPENEAEQQIIALLGGGIANGDDLLAASKLSAQVFNQHLTMLELKGVISPLGNNAWQLL